MLREQTLLTKLIWTLLLVAAGDALWNWQLSLVFIALSTLALSVAPALVARWADIHVPASFMLAVVAFVGGTLFLGEVYGFYERFWWWDVVMHGGSALGFGLIGFVFVFMLFQGDRFAAPHGALALLAFCFALAIGALWEIFEYTMDNLFGTNMQKSGLVDTMNDLIVDVAGAAFGALAGWAYLKGRSAAGLQRLIGEFVERNPRFFRHRNRPTPRPTDHSMRRNGVD
ncbi:hypothetical protein U5922_004845 [Aquicoccus sp. G2-2]|uniref:hypothetical protein n=1 Tax=Aquicoccus sp. G2-2 TaxID=3092120 RepID=UPI002ADF5C70|nr:hypothetical protein [Aquicoccus sp. G2-2]MEA1112831.1 hypothetical protein [Aquicoccus sp. G2-2]